MEFVADCARCVGLCCVALTRTRSGGFGADIPAGVPCHHLQPSNACEIHATLRQDGWPACTVFDCFGAGQQVTQTTFGGTADWRDGPDTARAMFTAFTTMRHLMEMLRLATEARTLATGPLRARAEELTGRLAELVALPPADLAAVDVAPLRDETGPLLGEISEQCRHPAPRSKRFRPRAQLLGADLRGRDLSRFSLRGALLIAADLTGARLTRTDVLGADLRDTDLDGADLSDAIFLTQQQVDAARGTARTLLPPGITTPQHWS